MTVMNLQLLCMEVVLNQSRNDLLSHLVHGPALHLCFMSDNCKTLGIRNSMKVSFLSLLFV